jgi:hypothetical protein
MSWAAVGVGVGSAALGAWQQDQQMKNQQRAQAANMMANAAAMEYSPWTGMGKSMVGAEAGGSDADTAFAALEGGMAGYQFGKQFGKKPTTPQKKPSIYSGIDRKFTGGGFDPSATT